MNTAQLNSILSTDCEVSRFFIGVFPSNKIPYVEQGCMVINEDINTKEGSHWVALFKFDNGIVEYFDSYGRQPTAKWIKVYLTGEVVVVCKKQVQSLFSETCGHHCVYYLWHRARGVAYEDIVASYHTPDYNDEMVCQFIELLVQGSL